MGWDFLRHEITISRDSHGGEEQEQAIALHRDLLAHLRFEAACFLSWRDPQGKLLRWVSIAQQEVDRLTAPPCDVMRYRCEWRLVPMPRPWWRFWRRRGTLKWSLSFTPPLNIPGRSQITLPLSPPPPFGPVAFEVELTPEALT